MTDWLPTYSGQSQAVHVETDSEDKTVEPRALPEDGDTPTYTAAGPSINIDISSPDFIEDLLGYIFDGPTYRGKSPAIHVRGSVGEWPPVDPISSCDCSGPTFGAGASDDFERSVQRDRPAGFTTYTTFTGGTVVHDEPPSSDYQFYEDWKNENVLLAIPAHFAMWRYNVNTNDHAVNYGGHWGDSIGGGTWTSTPLRHMMQGVYDGHAVAFPGESRSGSIEGGYAYLPDVAFTDGVTILVKWRGFGEMRGAGVEPKFFVGGHQAGTAYTAGGSVYELDEAWQWTRATLDGSTYMSRTWYDGDAEPGTWDVSEAHALDADISGWTGVDASHVSLAIRGNQLTFSASSEFSSSYFPYGEFHIEEVTVSSLASGGVPSGTADTIDEFDRTDVSGWGVSTGGDTWIEEGTDTDGDVGHAIGFSGGLDVAGPNHATLEWGGTEPFDILVRFRFVNEGGDDLTYASIGLRTVLTSSGIVTLNEVASVKTGLSNAQGTAWRLASFSWDGAVLRAKSWGELEAVPLTWDDEQDDPVPVSVFDGFTLTWMGSNNPSTGIDASFFEVDWIRVDDGSCSDCAGYEDFTPGYMPLFRAELDDPKTGLDSNICLMEAAAMALDWHTRGATQVWGGDLIKFSGRTEQKTGAKGATLGGAAAAWQHYDQRLEIRTGQTWKNVLDALEEGRAVVLTGQYSSLVDAGFYCGSGDAYHGLVVLPVKRKDRWLVGDPLCTDFTAVSEDALQAYAETRTPDYGPTDEPGMLEPGNIDLANRPVVHNSNGTVSTVRSISIGVGPDFYLIPTVVGGEVVSNDDAIAHFLSTNEHLGRFDTEKHANQYAEKLHEEQDSYYSHAMSVYYGVTKKWTFAAGNGDLIWPVNGHVTQEYGCTGFPLEPARGGCAHFHDGIDIATDYGTPIRAAANGVIWYSGWGAGSNPSWIVGVDFGGGMHDELGHLQTGSSPSVGTRVLQGDVIGLIGLTGNTTGPHTHWSVFQDDVDFDPRLKIRGEPGDAPYPQSGND